MCEPSRTFVALTNYPASFNGSPGRRPELLNVSKAAETLSLGHHAADDYVKLLEAVFLIVRLPAWGQDLGARAGDRPKVHIVDSGLASRLLRVTAAKLSRSTPAALTQFGNLLETFVVVELMKQASWLEEIPYVGHWRTWDDVEVDCVIERDDGDVVGLEVKAAGRVRSGDFDHLRKLRDLLGDRFRAGVVFYTGARAYEYEDRLYAVPVDRLWR